MFISIILFTVIGLLLLALVRSTESILDLRQKRRDQGVDPKVYL